MNPVEFEFTPPPECPVFEPTVEEFKDPLGYIAKIRPVAEKTGICKIRPPPEWQPPFAVDVDNFRFTPRMQRLNELEATTRIKLNFLDQIAKFWELQGSPLKQGVRGSSLKIPNVERKALDLFTLYRAVIEEGGMEVVSRERKWSKIATRMGFPAGRGVGSLLRQHYERILYPYDVFQSGATLGDLNIDEDNEDCEKKDRDYIPHGIPSRQAIKPPDRYARRSKRHGKEAEENVDGVDYSTNSELKKLQFYGAGPKMPGYLAKGKYDSEDDTKFCPKIEFIDITADSPSKENVLPSTEAEKLGAILKTRREKHKGKRPIEQIVCSICNQGDEEASMLLCDGCDDSYHTFCLIPPLNEIPKGDWRCPRCVAEEVCKPQEAFGFEQAQREYTLQEFGEKADQFKKDYFNMPSHKVPFAMVEKEFWRIVNAVDEDVTVEYGADLHTIDHGSGFPNRKTKGLLAGDEEYVNSGWNLNNLPVLEASVLKHINADISGMKIPWTYVGMCFATFCWHNEDHWSYSINYLHWGEPKTWYGVPGGKAENFENAMRSVAPELFQFQPDLLHQLVTIMNPNLLISQGVPIFRTNQKAGEFVITFPRSYHAGFNQGYNFAEAVNFAPADWLPIGRVCVSHYGMLHRFCVFSHDELVCKMASDPERLDVSIAASTYQDMLKMVETEKELRKCLLEWGVNEAERENFELLPDDERQCDFCKTTCFLSAVTCSCIGNSLVCLTHKDKLCKLCNPQKHVLRYRYTLDELPVMLQRLKARAESFDVWANKVTTALDPPAEGTKYDISEFKEFIHESEEKRFPKTNLLHSLVQAVDEGEKCTVLAQQLLSRKVRTRNRQSGDSKYPARLTLEDLLLFHQQLSTLACDIKECVLVKDLLDRVLGFQKEAKEMLENSAIDSKKLEKLLDVSLNLDVDLPEVPQLKHKIQQTKWLEEMKAAFADPSSASLDTLRKLLDKGVNLPPHSSVEQAMADLQGLLTVGEKFEEKAKSALQLKQKNDLAILESILQETDCIPVLLPNVQLVRDAVRKANDWSLKVEAILDGTHIPYLDALESLVNKGRTIPVHMEQLPHVESQVEAARAWREKTARTFLKKNSSFSLVDILSPRKDIGIHPMSKGKKKKARDSEDNFGDELPPTEIKFEEAVDPAAIVAAFKVAERQEVDSMQQLRAKNLRKHLDELPDTRYCICNKAMMPNMLQCELCKDFFHVSCVPLPKSATVKKQQQASMSSAAVSQLMKDIKFLCPLCLRSRRPRLETILSLLVSLQKLPVRLPEGEALQCLTERGMSWQDRARQALATSELAAALTKLSLFSQKMVEQAAREKTEKIINSELMKAASNPELKPHLRTVAQSAFSGLHIKSDFSAPSTSCINNKVSNGDQMIGLSDVPDCTVPSVAAIQEVQSKDGSVSLDNSDVSVSHSLEHAYSSVSKNPTSHLSVASTPRKHLRKSPLVTRQMESPVLQLSDAGIAQLEQLMMEGDLLEMTLDETQHIWRILQATKLGKDSFSISQFSDLDDSDTGLKMKTKKRRKFSDVKNPQTKSLKHKMRLSEKGCKSRKKKMKMNPDLAGSSFLDDSMDDESERARKFKHKFEGKESKFQSGGMQVKKEFKDSPTKQNKMKALGLDRTPQKKMKRIGNRTKLERKDRKTNSMSINEPDDMCSASLCMRPTGDAVNWVQCDGGCELWFHLLCVGLDVTEVSETEDYICPNCSSSNKQSNVVQENPSVHIKMEVVEEDNNISFGNGSVCSQNEDTTSINSPESDHLDEMFTSATDSPFGVNFHPVMTATSNGTSPLSSPEKNSIVISVGMETTTETTQQSHTVLETL